MIIKSKPLSPFMLRLSVFLIGIALKLRLKRIHFDLCNFRPGHAYILMCNHASFVDGFLAIYYAYHTIWKNQPKKKFYIMSVKKQMLKNKWLRYVGSFSVDPGKMSIYESFDYAAEILNQPGNVLLMYPQGNLETCHINHIHFEPGVAEIASRVKGDCQLIWCSTVIDFFESAKMSLYVNMLDCGTASDLDFEALKDKVNHFHKKSMEKNIRFTFGKGVGV